LWFVQTRTKDRGIDGDLACLSSERGKADIRARVTKHVKPGILTIPWFVSARTMDLCKVFATKRQVNWTYSKLKFTDITNISLLESLDLGYF